MAFLGVGAVPYDLEPPSISAEQGIMRAVARGVYTSPKVTLARHSRGGGNPSLPAFRVTPRGDSGRTISQSP